MLKEQTLNQLRAPRPNGMLAATNDAANHITDSELPFEQRLALLVQREVDWRDSKRLSREVINSLADGDWLRHGHNVLVTGATGCSKTWRACALGQQASRQGFSVLHTRRPRLLHEPHVAHGDGSLGKRLAQLTRLDLLILDNFGNAPIAARDQCDALFPVCRDLAPEAVRSLLARRTTGTYQIQVSP